MLIAFVPLAFRGSQSQLSQHRTRPTILPFSGGHERPQLPTVERALDGVLRDVSQFFGEWVKRRALQ